MTPVASGTSTLPKALASVLLTLLAACTPSPLPEDAGPADAGASDAGAVNDAGTNDDAGTSSNAACSFNDDCPAAERCECDEATGCFCHLGERGMGVNGVDTCSDGNDCASALCVEGNGGAYYCSDECVDDGDCGPELPVCADIAFVGRICIRQAS